MKKTIVVCIVVLFAAIWFGATRKADAINPQDDSEITVTRQRSAAYNRKDKSWGYLWHVTIKCDGREFTLTIDEYLARYADAVNAAVKAGKAKETVAWEDKLTDNTLSESTTVTTTYTGKCVPPSN